MSEKQDHMSFNEYQERTEETAIYPSGTVMIQREDGEEHEIDLGVIYTALEVSDEAGEVAGKAKKYMREGDESYLEDMEAEIGDVLWPLARLADELGLSLGDIAEQNNAKLEDRKQRGQLTGEGDNR